MMDFVLVAVMVVTMNLMMVAKMGKDGIIKSEFKEKIDFRIVTKLVAKTLCALAFPPDSLRK